MPSNSKKRSENKYNVPFGRYGEQCAVSYLEQDDYQILACNYRTKLGEIDIIAQKAETIYIVEVKTRSSFDYGVPSEIINYPKLKRMENIAWIYLKQTNQEHKDWQIVIIEVMDGNCTLHEVIL